MPDDAPGADRGDRDEGASRAGEDARRRGWFWHWNTIITQYAPLVGLKGVGLLNSYTVWTDRREESPHRGYAFPSQQAEADFYGEDRAELITINKVLVALDLIEIRKEMVLRVDGQGRRWRVPHNLYRVKDHREGYLLTARDVLRVADLAARDPAVYRYVRRIFSPRFDPIDRDNVWHEILPAVRESEIWQRLAAKASRDEERASARTRAGHVTRARGGDSESAPAAVGNPARAGSGSDVAGTNSASGGAEPDVAGTNRGSSPDVAPANHASRPPEGGTAGETNTGSEEVVAGSNTTYHQDASTTTTTTVASLDPTSGAAAGPPGSPGAGPLPEPSAAVLACFTAANDREPSPLERQLLAELELGYDDAARAAGAGGAEWVAAAIREAVASGSRFVAPKRIREILTRWAAEPPHQLRASGPATSPARLDPAAGPDLPLPHGTGSRRTWELALRLLARSVGAAEMARLFDGSQIVDYDAGTVSVAVSSLEAAERLSGEYYDLVSRKLGEAMRRPVRVRFHSTDGGLREHAVAPERPAPVAAADPPAAATMAPPRFVLPGGLTNQQVWAAAQDELLERLSPANFEAWIRPAALIGVAEDGALVVGVPNAFAQRRIAALLPQVRAVLGDILGGTVEVRIAVARDWLRGDGGGPVGDGELPPGSPAL
ncbi:MAG TPA: DnaA N-terminal domain-containing protein [Thermomicrobiaceae bacterium]|nr:DnaA N-terminal domain-containing protein [Thermomicrobiaceae bacterium]